MPLGLQPASSPLAHLGQGPLGSPTTTAVSWVGHDAMLGRRCAHCCSHLQSHQQPFFPLSQPILPGVSPAAPLHHGVPNPPRSHPHCGINWLLLGLRTERSRRAVFCWQISFFFFWFVCLPFYYLNSQVVFGHCCPHRLLVGALSKITVNKPFTFSRRKPPLQSKLRKYLHLVVSMYSPVYHTTHFKTAMHNLLVQKIGISPLGTVETINCPIICLPVCTKSVNVTFTLGLFCFSNSLTCLSPPWLQDGDASRPAARRLG